MTMRIGVVGPGEPDSFADNILATLTAMGHQAVPLGPTSPTVRPGVTTNMLATLFRSTTVASRWQEHLVRKARERDLELVITVQASLLPSVVATLRREGRTVALWFPDAVVNLDRQLMLAAPYDAVFFKDRMLVERLTSLTDAPVHYLPEACNPAWHHPGPRDDVDPKILVAGNLYPSRVLLLDRLHRAGIPLALHSSAGGWPRWLHDTAVQSLPVQPEVRRAAKARAFRRAAAVLNNLHPAEMDSVNCRLFEAAGCGAVVLTESRPVLGTLFELGTEVLAFTTFDELVAHCRHALDHSNETTPIGDAAATRAHAEHTYEHRLVEMFDVLGMA